MPLTVLAIENAAPRDKPYKLTDSGSLFLLVNPNGSRWWRFKYRFGGKEKTLALGAYPAVSLKKAREGRDDAKRLLREGSDPAAERKTEKRAKKLVAEHSFEAIAREFIENQRNRWTIDYANAMRRRFELNVFPDLGARPIAEITPLELLDVLREIEARGCHELAHRMLQACGQIFRYGVVTSRAPRDVAADLRGALVPYVKQHRAAVKPEELPELLAKIDGYAGSTRSGSSCRSTSRRSRPTSASSKRSSWPASPSCWGPIA
jgi:hypothetical protein